LRIIVPIKQVPETLNVKMDEETGTMIREGVESIVNPLDLYAIEAAIGLRESLGGRVTAISMGPGKAIEALREAIAMGCDDAVLISDKSLAGSDTWATSLALSRAISRLGGFDLILCGERATDGDTGQVGPGIASHLDLPLATYVSRIDAEQGARTIRVRRLVEEGYEILRLPLPALLTVVKEISEPRLPTLAGKKRAKSASIPTWTREFLNLSKEEVGLSGSPTRVIRIRRPVLSRSAEVVSVRDENDLEEATDRLVRFLEERNIL